MINRNSVYRVLIVLGLTLIAIFSTIAMAQSEVIVDNDQLGTSYTGGPWGYSSGANPYGGSSRTEMAPGAAYTFKAPISGSYEVSLWWTYWPSRCTNVPVDIYDGYTLIDTVWVNHQRNAGQWNLLGVYFFSRGTARIVIRSESNTCSTCADAVRFEPY